MYFYFLVSDVPPLEDMSELLKQVDFIKEVRQVKQHNGTAENVPRHQTTTVKQQEKTLKIETVKAPKTEETLIKKVYFNLYWIIYSIDIFHIGVDI